MNRWAELFGCPTKAARTIIDKGLAYDLLDQCDDCPHYTEECLEPSGTCAMQDENGVLGWLLEEVER